MGSTVSEHARWLTVQEAVSYHLEHSPRTRPIHRSAVYRWASQGVVRAEYRGGQLYIDEDSLALFCAGQPAARMRAPRPADVQRGEEAAARLRRRLGTAGRHRGGDA